MILASRCIAWLDTTPKEADKNRRESMADGMKYDLPPFLLHGTLEIMRELGFAELGAAGLVPLTNTSIYHFKMNSGLNLSPFECSIIIDCSRAYVSQRQLDDKSEPYPYLTKESIARNRQAVANRLASRFKLNAKIE